MSCQRFDYSSFDPPQDDEVGSLDLSIIATPKFTMRITADCQALSMCVDCRIDNYYNNIQLESGVLILPLQLRRDLSIAS